MTYGDFVRMVQAKAPVDCSRAGIDVSIRLVFDVIAGSVKAGEAVSIPGFGKFSLSHRKARLGTNPRTGEAVQIPERMVVTFSPAEQFKNDVRVIPGPDASVEPAAVPEEAAPAAPAEAPAAAKPQRKKRG